MDIFTLDEYKILNYLKIIISRHNFKDLHVYLLVMKIY